MAVVMALQNLRADGDIAEEGGVSKMNVVDVNNEMILDDVLSELKKMNINMAILADNYAKDTEV